MYPLNQVFQDFATCSIEQVIKSAFKGKEKSPWEGHFVFLYLCWFLIYFVKVIHGQIKNIYNCQHTTTFFYLKKFFKKLDGGINFIEDRVF
jgi:hypothetical protein